MDMPVDASLIDELRAEALDALLDDYVSIGRLQTFARRIRRDLNEDEVRLLVTEVLASLVHHPDAKVIDGGMRHIFASPEEIRRHVDDTWQESGPRPGTGQVAWVVKRDYVVNSNASRDPQRS